MGSGMEEQREKSRSPREEAWGAAVLYLLQRALPRLQPAPLKHEEGSSVFMWCCPVKDKPPPPPNDVSPLANSPSLQPSTVAILIPPSCPSSENTAAALPLCTYKQTYCHSGVRKLQHTVILLATDWIL